MNNGLTKLLHTRPMQSPFDRTCVSIPYCTPICAGQLLNDAFRRSLSTCGDQEILPHFMCRVFLLRWSLVTGDTSLELDQWKCHCRMWIMEVRHKLCLFLLATRHVVNHWELQIKLGTICKLGLYNLSSIWYTQLFWSSLINLNAYKSISLQNDFLQHLLLLNTFLLIACCCLSESESPHLHSLNWLCQ